MNFGKATWAASRPVLWLVIDECSISRFNDELKPPVGWDVDEAHI
jgi:hypothetical protein